jgi:hypothetical protein
MEAERQDVLVFELEEQQPRNWTAFEIERPLYAAREDACSGRYPLRLRTSAEIEQLERGIAPSSTTDS